MAEKEKKVTQTEDKPAKPEKVKKEKKKGRIKEAWRGFKSETKKIVWLPWDQTKKNTWVVLVVLFVCAAVICLLDFGLGHGILAFINLF